MYQKPKRFGRPSLRNSAALAVTVTAASLILPVQQASADEQIACRESASIYAALPGGELREYFHNTPETGTYDWNPEKKLADNWSQMTVITGADGRLYQITNEGELRRYKHDGSDWERPGGNWYISLGTGWGLYRDTAYKNRITVDSKGDVYAIAANGDLTWGRFNEQAATWEKRVLATGWTKFDLITAAGDGVIYARDASQDGGKLYRTHYHAESQRRITYIAPMTGSGWNTRPRVFSPGADVLYGVETNGNLWWYRRSETTDSWATQTLIGQGWGLDWQIGAMSNACTLAGLPVPQRPAPRPIQDLARSALIEGQPGLIQAFYVDSYGTLKAVTQRQGSPIDFLDTAAIDSPSTVSTTPSAIMTKDGQPNVYALGTTTDTLEATRSSNGVSWPTTSSFGGWTVGPTSAAKYRDGRKQFFAVDAAGRLLARSQHTVDGHVWPWAPVGFSNLAGEVTVLPAVGDADDLEVLVTYASGFVVTSRYVNRALTNVRTVSAGAITNRPAGVVKLDGKVQIFGRRADGKIYTVRDTASGLDTTWTLIDGISTDGSPAAVISGGRITLAARATDGYIYTNRQSSTDGPFTGWTKLVDSRTGNAWPADTEPSMVVLSGGKVVVMYRSADEVTYAFESTPAATNVTARSASGGDRYVGGPSPKPRR